MNKLSQEQSLYLQQHASNPVEWHAWNEDTLKKARDEQKLMFVSIGYSSCHWCHVMEHESFEDAEVAEAMNRFFVCVKVDREERPDVDAFYMEAIQRITGQGGWPLNVFTLPDGRPFYGVTYFPKKDLLTLIDSIVNLYAS
ncbi:MAG: thioredoxin domain-containing protein, partial [Bacteroidetes bacterium HGW-Bacteroidetes-21]